MTSGRNSPTMVMWTAKKYLFEYVSHCIDVNDGDDKRQDKSYLLKLTVPTTPLG